MTTPSLSKRIAHGALWHAGGQWGLKLLGLVHLAITARLLVPEAFGILAFSASISEFAVLIMATTASTSLIRLERMDDSHIATAFWLRAGLALLFAAAFAASAPSLSHYMQTPGAWPVLAAMAGVMLIDNLTSTSIFARQRSLDMRPAVLTTIVRESVRISVGITLALIFKSVWALVAAQACGALAALAYSHTAAPQPFAPFKRSSLKDIAHVFRWGMVEHLGAVFFQRLDRLYLAGFVSTNVLGIYSVVVELALLPVNMIISPMMSALLPGLKEAQNRGTGLPVEQIQTALSLGIAVILPASVGLALVADWAVPLLLGPVWVEGVPILQAASLIAFALGLFNLSKTTLVAAGYLRSVAALSAGQGLLFVPLLYWGYTNWGLEGAAFMRGATTFVCGLLAIGLLAYASQMRLLRKGFLTDCLSSLLAGGAMLGFVLAVKHGFNTQGTAPITGMGAENAASAGALAPFLVSVAGGGAVYVGVRMLFWWLRGRPDALEKRLFTLLADLRQRRH